MVNGHKKPETRVVSFLLHIIHVGFAIYHLWIIVTNVLIIVYSATSSISFDYSEYNDETYAHY